LQETIAALVKSAETAGDEALVRAYRSYMLILQSIPRLTELPVDTLLGQVWAEDNTGLHEALLGCLIDQVQAHNLNGLQALVHEYRANRVPFHPRDIGSLIGDPDCANDRPVNVDMPPVDVPHRRSAGNGTVQCGHCVVVLSGESGAGKTFAACRIIPQTMFADNQNPDHHTVVFYAKVSTDMWSEGEGDEEKQKRNQRALRVLHDVWNMACDRGVSAGDRCLGRRRCDYSGVRAA
jgi:hypothetical protein